MAAKRRARRPRPDDSKELGHDGGIEEEEESGKSGETAMSAEPKEMPLMQAESPARSAPRGGRVPPPDDTADAGLNKRAVTSTSRRGPPPQQGEERPARSDGETLAASVLQQLRNALTKPTSPPSSPDVAQEEDETPSSPDTAQEDENHGREMAEQEQSNTSPSQEEHGASEEEQQEKKKITEQDHASNTSPPHDKDMHCAHGEEQQEKEAANQEHADDTSPPKDNRSAPSTKPHGSETKKAAVERAWSNDDELKILNALVVHAQSHNGALPDSSLLLANLTFDKTDATEDKLTDKIRKLRRRYCKFLVQGCPSDGFSRQLFKLSEILWGQVDEDEQVEPSQPTSRDFSVLSKLYPHLAKEVKSYAETHSSGDLVMAMFMNIGDEKARDLDAKCKKQHIEAFKLELGQASLTNELLSALSSLTTKITDTYQPTPCKRRAENLKEPLDEQYLRRSKRVVGKTEGFKDKPNADKVFNPNPLAMATPDQGH